MTSKLKIQYRKTETLIPYARNARTHSDEQIAQVAASISEFGFTNPILVDGDSGIIAGHGRLLAAQRLDMDQVPVIELANMTEEQRRAYVIADNKLALNAGWDDELLSLELGELAGLDVNIALTGFSQDELDALNKSMNGVDEGLTDPDDTPEVQDQAITQPSDVWVLGMHRLKCGDSTSSEDVDSLLAGAHADLCFTSPPYGQQRDYTEESKDKLSDWDGLMRGVFANLPMSESGQVLVNLGLIHRDGEWLPYWDGWIEWMRAQGWRRFGWYVWDQGCGLPGDWSGRFAPSHEWLFHFNKKSIQPQKWVDKQEENIRPRNAMESTMRGKDGKLVAFTNPGASSQPTKVPDSVIRIGRQNGSDGHPAQFSIKFALAVVYSFPGAIYEPFSGSGTTIIAAEKTGRACYAMEISPQYVDLAVRRWQNFTGNDAVLESSGEIFNQIALRSNNEAA